MQTSRSADFEARRNGSKRLDDRYSYLAGGLQLVVILSSVAAALVAQWNAAPKMLTSALAGIPSVIGLTRGGFHLAAKSQWRRAKYAKLDDLVRGMQLSSMSAAQADTEFTKFMEIHDKNYPGDKPPSR